MKAKKPLVRTDYAIRGLRPGFTELWWSGARWGPFPHARLYTYRSDARNDMHYRAWTKADAEIVDVRGRPLSTRTKASGKRTR